MQLSFVRTDIWPFLKNTIWPLLRNNWPYTVPLGFFLIGIFLAGAQAWFAGPAALAVGMAIHYWSALQSARAEAERLRRQQYPRRRAP